VHYVDFDTRRRLMGSCTIGAPLLKPHQLPVYRAYINPQCGHEEIMKTKLFCLRVWKPQSSVTLSLCFIDWYNTTCLAAVNPDAAFRSSGRVIGGSVYPSARPDPWIRISRCWPVLHCLTHSACPVLCGLVLCSLFRSIITDTLQPVLSVVYWLISYSLCCSVL